MKLHKEYTEAQLIAMLVEGNNKGFSYLCINYSRELFRVIVSIVPERQLALDILQDVFLHIFQKINTYDSKKATLYTWMVTIARNLAKDMVKSKTYRNDKMHTDMSLAHSVHSASGANDHDCLWLHKIFIKLDPKYSKILELNYLQGYTQLEISEILNIPLGTVKSRIRTGLLKMKEMM